MRLYADIRKVSEQDDGSIEVEGIASTGAKDSAGETILPDAIKAALPDYLKFPTLREMHQLSAAGITIDAVVGDDGVFRIVAKVVDPVAIAKVKSGVYRGFSVGGKVLARDPTDRTVITKLRLSEISIVDRPCNPEAVLEMWKVDDMQERDQAAEGGAGEDTAEKAAPPAQGSQEPASEAEVPAGGPETEAGEAAKGAGAEEPAAAAEDPAAKADAPADPAVRAREVAAALERAVEKAIMPEGLHKGMYSVSRFAEVLSSIAYLLSDAEDEAAYEKDNSAVPARLRSWLGDGAAIFKEMAVEEVNELIARVTAQKADKGEPIGKAEAAPEASAEVLAKVSALEGENGDLRKALDDVTGKMAGIIERLAKVEAQPLPPKTAGNGFAKAVDKTEDAPGASGAQASAGSALSVEDVQKALEGMPEDERARVLTKAALARPIMVAPAR